MFFIVMVVELFEGILLRGFLLYLLMRFIRILIGKFKFNFINSDVN